MPRYLISFDDGSMDHVPDEDWTAVADASHAVVREAKAARIAAACRCAQKVREIMFDPAS